MAEKYLLTKKRMLGRMLVHAYPGTDKQRLSENI